MKNKIDSLIKLLDDDNPQHAQIAMAALLKHEDVIADWLAHHQESEQPLMRKRIHQLQAIITLRQRRRNFELLLKNENPDMIDGLIEVHLQWYDNDSKRSIEELWHELLKTSKRFNAESLERIAYFMRKCGFEVAPKDELQVDFYCIGPVLEDMIGADFILCAIAMAIAATKGTELKIVRMLGDFGLVDSQGRMLTPKNNWELIPQVQLQVCDLWDKRMILKLASSMLFTFAVSSDSFRYVDTIGHSLAGIPEDKAMDFLPYPYSTPAGKNEPEN